MNLQHISPLVGGELSRSLTSEEMFLPMLTGQKEISQSAADRFVVVM